jgi:hypothetical protein
MMTRLATPKVRRQCILRKQLLNSNSKISKNTSQEYGEAKTWSKGQIRESTASASSLKEISKHYQVSCIILFDVSDTFGKQLCQNFKYF